MSTHDEHRASAYLRARTYPARRRKHRGLVAAGIVLLVLICLLGRCARAEVWTAVVSGEFVEEAPGSVDYLNAQRQPQTPVLTLPIPFSLVVRYDTEAEKEIDVNHAEYESANGSMTLYLGSACSICIAQPESQVQVWNNQIRAVGFGSNEPFTWGGLSIGNYGIFGFFWNTAEETPVPNSDDLHWLYDLQDEPILRPNAYVIFRGFLGSQMVYLRTRGALRYYVYQF